MLKIDPVGFLMNGCESKSGVKNDSKVLRLRNWRDRFTVYKNGEGCGGAGLRGSKKFWGCFRCYSSRDFELVIGYSHLEFGREV